MTTWWASVGYWSGHGRSARWYGPEQKGDRSPENIRRCYSFLRRLPYQSAEDHARLNELEAVEVAEVVMTDG